MKISLREAYPLVYLLSERLAKHGIFSYFSFLLFDNFICISVLKKSFPSYPVLLSSPLLSFETGVYSWGLTLLPANSGVRPSIWASVNFQSCKVFISIGLYVLEYKTNFFLKVLWITIFPIISWYVFCLYIGRWGDVLLLLKLAALLDIYQLQRFSDGFDDFYAYDHTVCK